jgi:hypothetical protein
MKINKQLKNASFSYDEEEKSFTIVHGDGLYTTVELNKVYAFAFMRFVIRIAQRNWLKANKIPRKNKEPSAVVEEECLGDSDQLVFLEE